MTLSAAECIVLISCRVTIEKTAGSDGLWISISVTQGALDSHQSFSTNNLSVQYTLKEWDTATYGLKQQVFTNAVSGNL